MSIKLMSAIFATKFRDLKDATGNVTKASTATLVLLALADHANDGGEGAYPGLVKMELKTGLSHQTILSAYKTLKHNGLITYIGKSKLRTCDYTINAHCFPGKGEPLILGNQADVPLKPLECQDSSHLSKECKPLEYQDSSHLSEGCKPLEYQDSSHLSGVVKPLYLNPYLTTLKPSIEIDSEFKKIWNELEQVCGAVPPDTTRLINVWLEKHAPERIIEAIGVARDKGARSPRYIDQVLITWEANGYPPTREEQVLARAFKPSTNKAAVRANNALTALLNYGKVLEANGE